MNASSPLNDHPWRPVAELIQPALIRLLDHLRKQLETTPWQGSYETVELWPEGVEPTTTPPQVLYWLHLSQGQHHQRVNLWELCYQICFWNYKPCLERAGIADFQIGEVEVDRHLFTTEGEIDWQRLDEKARQVVAEVIDGLP